MAKLFYEVYLEASKKKVEKYLSLKYFLTPIYHLYSCWRIPLTGFPL